MQERIPNNMNDRIKKEVGRNSTSEFRIIKFGKGISPQMQNILIDLWSKEWDVNPGCQEQHEKTRSNAKNYRLRKKSREYKDLRLKRKAKMIL